MNKIHWESVLGYLDDRYIQEAASGCLRGCSASPAAERKEHTRMKTITIRRAVLLAAALALVAALSVIAYATDLFGIRDMKAEITAAPEAELINITGYRGSKQYQASVEWQNYLEEADQNGTNPFPAEQTADRYWQYNAFSQEAKDRLDALLEKYGLRMCESREGVAGQEGLYASLGASGFLPASAGLQEIQPGGTVIDGKSIYSFCDSADLSNGKNIPYDLFRIQADTFVYTGFLVGDVEDFQEWTYTAKDGAEVTLCLGRIQSVLIAPLDNCFVFFNIRTGSANDDPNRGSYGRDALTKEDLEEFAGRIDFAALNNIG